MLQIFSRILGMWSGRLAMKPYMYIFVSFWLTGKVLGLFIHMHNNLFGLIVVLILTGVMSGAMARRMHDFNKSSIVPFIWLLPPVLYFFGVKGPADYISVGLLLASLLAAFVPGSSGANMYGPEPKNSQSLRKILFGV